MIPYSDRLFRHLQQIQDNPLDKLTLAKAAQAIFYNGSQRTGVKYSPGDLMWLSRRDLKTKRPSEKLEI